MYHQGQQQNQDQQQQQQQQQRRNTNDSKLQAVFSKLSGVFPRAGDLGPTQEKVTTDIIESVLTAPIPIPQQWSYDAYTPVTTNNASTPCTPSSEPSDADTISALCARLESELRMAKRTHLSCGEVLLPCDLLPRISRDIIAMAESEPCGLRGCTLYLSFEGECRGDEGVGKGGKGEGKAEVQLGIVKCDPGTASTFEVYLTLKQAGLGGWNSFLPQFIKNLTRGNTVMISAAYTLRKNKLYRSYIE